MTSEIYQSLRGLVRDSARGRQVTFCIDAFPTWFHGKVTGILVVEAARALGFDQKKVNQTTPEELEGIIGILSRMGAQVIRLENNEGFSFRFSDSDVPVNLRIK